MISRTNKVNPRPTNTYVCKIKIGLMSCDQKSLALALKKANAFGYSNMTYYMFSLLRLERGIEKICNSNIGTKLYCLPQQRWNHSSPQSPRPHVH